MAKINLIVKLKKDNGVQLGTQIDSGDHSTLSAAKAAVQVVIDQRVAEATQNAADLDAANSGFNS